MTLKVEIRDYRGVERCDIELSPICLVAGNNEQGKSGVAQAVRAGLTPMVIPIAGVLKKDAKLLVRDGADKGHVTVTAETSATGVCWPACTVDSSGDIKCSDYASGFTHVLDLNIKDRSKVLAHYMKSEPTKDDIEKAATDAGYSAAAVAKIVESITTGGWDHTYAKTRDYTVNLKGQWQGATGERYGPKKGEDFRAVGDRDLLADALLAAEDAVVDTAGAVAVSEAEVDNLKRQVKAGNTAENKLLLNDQLNTARDSLVDIKDDRAAQPDDPESVEVVDPIPCPECGAALKVIGGFKPELRAYKEPVQPEALTPKQIKRRDDLDLMIDKTEKAIGYLEERIWTSSRLSKEGDAAKIQLEEIDKAPKVDEASMELAKDAVGDARSALTDFDNRVKAYKIHGDLVKNDLLIKVLAPDGLRKRVLVAKLDDFNRGLNDLCSFAKWSRVYLDENLECHYGKRPLWAASMSGQWRARAVIQVAMARMDDSAAVILDEADILDTQGRNGLFSMLKESGMRALVCMTFSGRAKVPNLKLAKLGRSYWIELGICEELG